MEEIFDFDYNKHPNGIVPAMLRVQGKRFACEVCGVTVFGHDIKNDLFYCNGCDTIYQGY